MISTAMSQDYSFERLFKGISEDNEWAAKFKVKTEVVYSHKSEESKKGEFLYKKHFNNTGKLVSSRWLDKSINKFVDTDYAYDTKGRLTKITNSINTLINDLDLIIVNYNEEDKVRSMLHYYGPKGSVKMDTLTYIYNSAGNIQHKVLQYRTESIWLSDTIFYVYNEKSELWYTHKRDFKVAQALSLNIINGSSGLTLWVPLKNTTFVYGECFLNIEGCMTKVNHPHNKNFIEIERDSLCNLVHWKLVNNVKEKWLSMEEGKRSYKGNSVMEEKVYNCKSLIKSNCDGNLTFEEHTKYNYSNNGLLLQKYWYKENGKLKRVKKHTYEFY